MTSQRESEPCLFQTFKSNGLRGNAPLTLSTEETNEKFSETRTEFLLHMQEELGGKVASLENELRNGKSLVVRPRGGSSLKHDSSREGSLKRDASRAFKNCPISRTSLSTTQSPGSWVGGDLANWRDHETNYGMVNHTKPPTMPIARPNATHRRQTPTLMEESASIYASRTLAPLIKHDGKPGDPRSKSRVTFAPAPEQPKTVSDAAKTKSQNSRKKKSRIALLHHKHFYNVVITSLILLLLLSSCCLIYFITQTSALPSKPANNVTKATLRRNQDCVMRDDVTLYSKLHSMMDTTADPCTDFYQYACGEWMRSNYYPQGRFEYGVSSAIAEKNDRVLLEILARGPSKWSAMSSAERKAKTFFQSCMDLARIEALGAQPLRDLINSLGGWSVLQPWNESMWDLNSNVFACQGRLSISVFFSISISPNPFQPRNNALIIDTNGALSLGDESFYLDSTSSKYEQKFKDAMSEMLRLLTLQNVNDVVDDVFLFEKQLAVTLFRNSLSTSSVPFELVSIRRLATLCPHIAWRKILGKIFKSAPIDLDFEVVVKGPVRFFADLSTIILRSSPRTLHNYVMWRIVFARADRLSLGFRRAISSMNYEMLGVDSRRSRWRECLDYVKDQFGEALELLFARERLPMQEELKVQDMAQQIKKTYLNYVEKLDWLDSAARYALTKQLESTRIRIGVDRRSFEDPSRLDKLYQFPVDQQRFFSNFLLSVENKVKKTARTLMKKSDSLTYLKPFDNAWGYYVQEKQEVVIPVGYLQPPIFDPKAPDVVNFGSLGTAIGHEMTHAFDLIGKNFSTELRKIHEKKKNCIVTKFHRFTGNLDVGRITRFENIADASGVRVALAAYRENRRSDSRFHADFNNEQLFFISYAQSWCTKRARDVIIVGEHAPEKYRVLGSLSEVEDFSQSFSCKNETVLNPKERCGIW